MFVYNCVCWDETVSKLNMQFRAYSALFAEATIFCLHLGQSHNKILLLLCERVIENYKDIGNKNTLIWNKQ